MSLTREEKEKLLRALEEDRELRYALMGLLGYKEVLERIARLEERFAQLEERFARLEERVVRLEEKFVELEERFQKLEERVVRLEERVASLEEKFAQLEERFARLEERYQILEGRFQRLEERVVRLEERFAQLEERFARLEERYQKLEERFVEVERRLAEHDASLRRFEALVKAVAHRFGVISEEAFREAVRFIVEETLGAARVERLVLHDREGIVYGHEAVVEVDLVVRDGVHVLVEVKSRVSRGDVAELARIGLLYQRFRGVKPRLVIVGALIDEDAWETARRLGVEVRPITQE